MALHGARLHTNIIDAARTVDTAVILCQARERGWGEPMLTAGRRQAGPFDSLQRYASHLTELMLGFSQYSAADAQPMDLQQSLPLNNFINNNNGD